jgi:hypothetical protein
MTETWNETTPASTEVPTLGDDRIRELKRALRERLAMDHDFEASESTAFGDTGSTIGMHEALRLKEQSSSPTTLANVAGVWAADDGAGNTELYMRGPSDGSIIQLTEGGMATIRQEIVSALKDLTAAISEINQVCYGHTRGGTSPGDMVTIDDTQTLTNKTLTSPALTSPTITSPTITGNATVSGALDIGSLTTKRVAPAGTFVNSANGDPTVAAGSFDINSSITAYTWESVGPTGSGADNIWTAMNGVPADADWIEVKCAVEGRDGAASSNLAGAVYARENGGSGTSDGETLMSSFKHRSDASGNAFCGNVSAGIKIPIDSSRRFQAYWYSLFTNTSILLYITGWGFNP